MDLIQLEKTLFDYIGKYLAYYNHQPLALQSSFFKLEDHIHSIEKLKLNNPIFPIFLLTCIEAIHEHVQRGTTDTKHHLTANLSHLYSAIKESQTTDRNHLIFTFKIKENEYSFLGSKGRATAQLCQELQHAIGIQEKSVQEFINNIDEPEVTPNAHLSYREGYAEGLRQLHFVSKQLSAGRKVSNSLFFEHVLKSMKPEEVDLKEGLQKKFE